MVKIKTIEKEVFNPVAYSCYTDDAEALAMFRSICDYLKEKYGWSFHAIGKEAGLPSGHTKRPGNQISRFYNGGRKSLSFRHIATMYRVTDDEKAMNDLKDFLRHPQVRINRKTSKKDETKDEIIDAIIHSVTYNYLKKIKAQEESDINIIFSIKSVLTDLLEEARETIWTEDKAKTIYEDIEGFGWHTKLKVRFKEAVRHSRLSSNIFQRLCDYLDKDPNLLLNEGECFLTKGVHWILFDPYEIVKSEEYQKKYRTFRPFNNEVAQGKVTEE